MRKRTSSYCRRIYTTLNVSSLSEGLSHTNRSSWSFTPLVNGVQMIVWTKQTFRIMFILSWSWRLQEKKPDIGIDHARTRCWSQAHKSASPELAAPRESCPVLSPLCLLYCHVVTVLVLYLALPLGMQLIVVCFPQHLSFSVSLKITRAFPSFWNVSQILPR